MYNVIIFLIIIISFSGVLYYATGLCRLGKEKDDLRKRYDLVVDAINELVSNKDHVHGLMFLYDFICRWHSRLNFESIPNLGHDRYGIFRCDHMNNVTPDNIYLGGIYGLYTNTLRCWSDIQPCENDALIVYEQLNDLLLTNLKAEAERLFNKIYK